MAQFICEITQWYTLQPANGVAWALNVQDICQPYSYLSSLMLVKVLPETIAAITNDELI